MERRDFLKTAGLATMLLSSGEVLLAADKVSSSTGESISESKRRIPVTRKADVVVCGGGPSGIGAAIEAARSGAKVILIEHAGFLGGTWTAGLMGVMLDHENKQGLLREIMNTLIERKWCNTEIWTDELFTFDIERMKLLLDELCQENKIDVLLYTSVVDSVVKNGRITHIVTESKSGREAIEGKIFIDATGDGDVAAMSGCGFDWGDDQGNTQPMSMLGILTGIKFEDVKDFVLWGPHKSRGTTKRSLLAEIQRSGFEPSYRKPCFFTLGNGVYMLMATHQYGLKSINRDDLTRASIDGRREVHQIVDSLRSLGGPWAGVQLVATASQIGCREGRRIHGLYTVTQDDLIEGRHHEDAACEVCFCVDVHSTKREHEDPNKSYNRGIRTVPYDIPVRAMIAKDVKGLMMVGRCISGDFIAHASYRVNPNSVTLGQSAGRVAATALREGIAPENVKFHYRELYK